MGTLTTVSKAFVIYSIEQSDVAILAELLYRNIKNLPRSLVQINKAGLGSLNEDIKQY